jgi:hypothetical protein
MLVIAWQSSSNVLGEWGDSCACRYSPWVDNKLVTLVCTHYEGSYYYFLLLFYKSVIFALLLWSCTYYDLLYLVCQSSHYLVLLRKQS